MNTTPKSVALKNGLSASSILQQILLATADRHPETFADVNIPLSLAQFRQRYITVIPAFEAARIGSHQSIQIACELADALSNSLIYTSGLPDEDPLPLDLAVRQPAKALATTVAERTARGCWNPQPEYKGESYTDLSELGSDLYAQNFVNDKARDAFDWLQQHVMENGQISLLGRKVVVMGAQAEMAATLHFLEAGADVLWIDIAPPPEQLINAKSRNGNLYWPRDNANLLEQPAAIRATIEAFSVNQPTDICLYAYAPGQARELRLTGSMNAIVNALPADIIASVTLLVSPTTASSLTEADLLTIDARRSNRPAWEAVLAKTGLLGQGGGAYWSGTVGATRSLVAIQGASYQAAQYLGKLMMAQRWTSLGQPGAIESKPLRVSANTAAITATSSLNHPVFDAAFGGANTLQVDTFSPQQSRCINGLLAIHDWLNPAHPTPGSIRVHGGIHTLPYPLNTALRIAAAIGFARNPMLLARLWR